MMSQVTPAHGRNAERNGHQEELLCAPIDQLANSAVPTGLTYPSRFLTIAKLLARRRLLFPVSL
jgi:hypothetical protein